MSFYTSNNVFIPGGNPGSILFVDPASPNPGAVTTDTFFRFDPTNDRLIIWGNIGAGIDIGTGNMRVSLTGNAGIGIGTQAGTSYFNIGTGPGAVADIRGVFSNLGIGGTSSNSLIDVSGEWNTTGTPTGIRLNVTDTASNAASLLMDLQVGGASQFSVNKSGIATAVGFTASGIIRNASGIYADNSSVRTAATGYFGWASAGGAGAGSPDVFLYRDAANTLAQRNGVNWQAFRIYSTYTDASNYERLEISQSGTGWYIGNGALGTGPGNRQITISAFGQLVFGSNGGAKWLINTTGHLLANTDNSFDIGASGANRPRNLFLGGNITAGGGLTLAAAGYLVWPGRGSFDAAAVDIVRLSGATVGAALQMSEMTAPAAPAANEVRIYAEDNGSGKTRLMARFATGAAQQIAIEP